MRLYPNLKYVKYNDGFMGLIGLAMVILPSGYLALVLNMESIKASLILTAPFYAIITIILLGISHNSQTTWDDKPIKYT